MLVYNYIVEGKGFRLIKLEIFVNVGLYEKEQLLFLLSFNSTVPYK